MTPFAATIHVLWALNASKMRFADQLHFSVSRAQRACLVAANVVLTPTTELTALPNPLAEFDGPLRGDGEREEEREGRKGTKGMGEKTSPNKFLVTPL